MILPGIVNSCCSYITTTQSKKARETLETVYDGVSEVSCIIQRGLFGD